ncbi:unnamed protein product, partial [Closterium sp. NIES-54]
WLSRDATARLAIRNHLPATECAHFGEHRTAQALYDAVVSRYSSPATAANGKLLLPYLFPELSAFATVADLVTHLRTSDARYHTPVPAEFLPTNQPPMFITLYFIVTRLPDSLRSVRDHFLTLDPTSLTADLLEQHLLAAETSAVAVGAARGTSRSPFFEGCSPSPLSSSFASAAAADVSIHEDVDAALTSAKRRNSKGKDGRGSGGGSNGGGGGSGSGSGGSGRGGGGSGGGGGDGTGGGGGGSGGGGGGSRGSGSSGGGGTDGGRFGPQRGGPDGGRGQQQQRRSETQTPNSSVSGWFSVGRVRVVRHARMSFTRVAVGARHAGSFTLSAAALPALTAPGMLSSLGGPGSEGAGSGGAEPEGVEPRGAESEGAESGGAEPRGAASSGGPAGAGDNGAGGAAVPTGAVGTGGVGCAGVRDPTEPGAAGAVGAGAGVAGVGGPGAGGAGAAGAGVGGTGAGGVEAAGAGAVDPGAGGAGDTVRLRPYFVPLLQKVLGVPSTGLPPPFLSPLPHQSQPPLQPASPLPAPSPYTEQFGGLTERREPSSRPVSPVRTARRIPPPIPGTHTMELPHAASPNVAHLLATAVTDPYFESAAASTLVAELLDFPAACRLDYATALVAESASASPPSIRGECALGTDVLEDRQEDFECLAAAIPRFTSMVLAPEGDPDAPDIPTPRSYAEEITGPYSSQWQAATDAEMAS